MAQQYTLQVQRRYESGKNANHRLRKQGYVPGVYYNNQKGENVPVKVAYGSLERMYAKAQRSNVIDLTIEDGQSKMTRPVLIWDVQGHPVKNLIIHTDFIGVDLKQELDVDVPVTVAGEAKGESDGGIVTIYRDTLTVTCLPTNIPDQLEIDVSALEVGDSILVQDLDLPQGVVVKDAEENYAVVGVSAPAAEEPEPGEAEEEAEEESPQASESEETEE